MIGACEADSEISEKPRYVEADSFTFLMDQIEFPFVNSSRLHVPAH